MKTKMTFLLAAMLIAFSGCGQAKETEETITASVEKGVEKENIGVEAKTTAAKEKAGEEASEEASSPKETSLEQLKKNTEKPEDGQKKAAGEKQDTGKAQAKAGKKDKADKKEETGGEEEEKELPEYTVTAFEEARTMYASNPVNVRKGPTTDFDRVGALNRAQQVSVTGQADTGWYEILYGEDKAFVSDHYLQAEVPAEEPAPAAPEEPQAPGQDAQGQQPAGPQPEPQAPVQAVTEVKNVAGVIMVGDSRFVQMQANIGDNGCTWIAESGKGYKWFNDNAVARIDGCVGKGSKVLINLGVNDPGNLNNYLTLVNAKAAEWVAKGATVYYASVNPVWENPHVTEEQVEYFNSQMLNGLSGDVHWIDSHSYLNSIGYKLVDGLHYNAETYQNLYAYFMSCL